ncbi:FRG domain-containing protein [Avibacterium avium]|uniref:FRG domain-containing protein n=1 Tax=Avibacterium avium TaxID=751 RepID=UPI003BF89917
MKNESIFGEIIIDTIEDFNDYIRKNFLHSLNKSELEHPIELGLINLNPEEPYSFFRGQAKESYELKSGLERNIDNNGIKNITSARFLAIQIYYLEKCKKLFRGKFSEQSLLLSNEFDDEIWAIGQHFGLKTPLLDWSRSFWVALFFAFNEYEPDEKYRFVYHLNTFMNSDIKIIETKIDIGGRINAQKGVFTKYLYSQLLEINERHNNYRKKFPHANPNYLLTRIKINSILRPNIMEFLSSININNSVLFPDITGAIRDCNLALHNIIQLETLPD